MDVCKIHVYDGCKILIYTHKDKYIVKARKGIGISMNKTRVEIYSLSDLKLNYKSKPTKCFDVDKTYFFYLDNEPVRIYS